MKPFARRLRLFGFAAAALTATVAMHAAAVVGATSSTFTPADSARTYMDIGAVWNGTTRIDPGNGDLFTVTLTNTGDVSAFDLATRIVLPAGFTRIGAASVSATSGSPVVTASQAGTTLTLSTSGYDLPVGASITYTYRLKTETTVAAGTYQLTPTWRFAPSNGGVLGSDVTTTQNVLVKAGAYTFALTSPSLTLAVNQSGSFTYLLTNTGLGGMFNTTIDESASNPGTAWDFTSFSAITAPVTTSLNGPGDILTVPYLAPGQTVQLTVNGTVTACLDIANFVTTNHLAGAVPVTTFSAVTLDLNQPLIAFTAPTTTLVYGSTVNVSVPILNTGNGGARLLLLDTNYPALGVAVSTIAAGWTYNSSTGRFTYTGSTPGGGGTGFLGNSSTVTLTYRLAQTDECGAPAGGTLLIAPSYTDLCGNAFLTPVGIGSVTAAADRPTVALAATASTGRLNVGNTSSFTFTLSGTNVANISTASATVTVTLAPGMTGIALTASAGTASRTGDIVTWTVAKATFASSPTLVIDFTAPGDPCEGGNQLTATGATNVLTTTAGCSLSGAAATSILLTNTTQGSVTQSFEVTPAAGDGTFETGVGSADLVRDNGEGEFIPFEATYTIAPGFPGAWSGTTYQDNFAGITQLTLVPGSGEVSIDGGGFGAVPGGSISGGTGSLTLDLSFLEGASYYNSAAVAGGATRTLVLRYKATAPDAALGAGTSRSATQLVTLNIASAAGGSGCGGGAFTQGAFYTIARAAATVGASMPSNIQICETFPVTLTVGNATPERASNIRVTFATSGEYSYLTGQTPTYGGVFNGGNITLAENGGTNPTFTFTGGDLTANGTITFNVRRKPSTSTATAAVSATVDYDDNETSPTAGTREFSANGSASPVLVRIGNLTTVASPSRVFVTTNTVQWTVYVVNGGSGDAPGTELIDVFPTGITPNAAATVTANPASAPFAALTGGDVGVAGATMTLQLDTIPAGYARAVTLVGTVDGNQCTFSSVPNAITARWGCAGTIVQTRLDSNPQFSSAAGAMQILHDTTNTIAIICATSTAEIIVRNVGLARLSDAEVSEVLDTATSGLTFLAGTVRYSLNGGAFNAANAAYDPSGAGTIGSPFLWDQTKIPELATLDPVAWGTGVNTIRIRFSVTANETTNASAPVLTASGTATIPCGDLVSSPGTPFTMPVQKPDITLVKTGINRTVAGGAFGTGTFAKTVYASSGDIVEWRLQITNSGNRVAENVRLRDTLAGSGGTSALKNSSGTDIDAAYVSGTNVALPNIAASTTVTYYLAETTGASCPTANNTAEVEWGCDNAAPFLISPSDNTDTALLNMAPGFGGSLAGTIAQTATTSYPTVDNGRVRHVITLTNGGGTAQSVEFDFTLPSTMDLDQSVTATVTGTGTYTGVTITGTHPTYHLQLTNAATGRMRNGQTAVITLYAIQRTNFDTTANTAAPTIAQACAYAMPETTGNSLDPALASASPSQVTIDLSFASTCGNAFTRNGVTANLNPLTPDIDLTITPALVQMAPSLAPYTFIFTYTVTNNGNAGSVANHLIFSMPTVGADWTSVSAALVTPGTGGAAGSTAVAPYDTLNLGRLTQGQSAVIQVTATTNGTPAAANLVLVGAIEGSTFNQGGVDTTNDFSLDRAAPCISTDLNISGYLYLDTDHDGVKDVTEAGTGLAGLFAKIIDHTSPATVLQSVAINSATGFYEFTGIPQGEYTIIVDNNATAGDVTPIAAPAGYVGAEYPALTRDNVAVGVTSIINQNFGLFAGGKLSGTVFRDNALPGGTANNGGREAAEIGLSGAALALTNNASNTTYDRTTTDGAGNYTLWIPTAAGAATLKVVETQPSGYVSTTGSAGTTGGAYTRASDTVAFLNVVGTTYTGVIFGEVPASVLTHDGAQTIVAGSDATYAHTFTAGTTGAVTFATAASAGAGAGTWSEVVYLDANCNGEGDPGETILAPASVTNVTAGQTVCIVVKEFAPVAAPAGATNKVVLTATFTALDGATLVFTETLTRTDVTKVGPGTTSGLDLIKEQVLDANCDAAETSGFLLDPITSGATPGACVKYRITYVNNGAGPLSTIVIHDATPAYTLFQSATADAPPVNLGGAVTIAAPALNGTGGITWTFTGTLAPAQRGFVYFTVRVSN